MSALCHPCKSRADWQGHSRCSIPKPGFSHQHSSSWGCTVIGVIWLHNLCNQGMKVIPQTKWQELEFQNSHFYFLFYVIFQCIEKFLSFLELCKVNIYVYHLSGFNSVVRVKVLLANLVQCNGDSPEVERKMWRNKFQKSTPLLVWCFCAKSWTGSRAYKKPTKPPWCF